MKEPIFWWIEGEKGIIKWGRERNINNGLLYESGAPNLQYHKKRAQELCYPDEKPIKVKLTKLK